MLFVTLTIARLVKHVEEMARGGGYITGDFPLKIETQCEHIFLR